MKFWFRYGNSIFYYKWICCFNSFKWYTGLWFGDRKRWRLKKVQVKSTGCKTANGRYQVALKSCGGTNGWIYKTLVDTKIDFLFVLNEKSEKYLIPKDKIFNKSTLNLCDKYREYRVKIWCWLKNYFYKFKN